MKTPLVAAALGVATLGVAFGLATSPASADEAARPAVSYTASECVPAGSVQICTYDSASS